MSEAFKQVGSGLTSIMILINRQWSRCGSTHANGTQQAMAQQIPTKAIATVACSSGLIHPTGTHLPDFGDEKGRAHNCSKQ
jgi:hypothetical protein